MAKSREPITVSKKEKADKKTKGKTSQRTTELQMRRAITLIHKFLSSLVLKTSMAAIHIDAYFLSISLSLRNLAVGLRSHAQGYVEK